MSAIKYILLLCLPLSFLAQTKTTFTLLDTNVAVGQIFTTRNIIFNNSNRISLSSEPSIDSVVNFMKKNPTVTLEIQYHSDTRGSKELLEKITQYQAEKIYYDIVSKGVAAQRLLYKGWGKNQPLIASQQVYNAKTQEEKVAISAINRRTVFKIVAVSAK